MKEFIQIITTIDSEEGAEAIAGRLVEAGLAACVQIVGPISSTYLWQGRVETAREWQCLIKTRRDWFPAVAEAVGKLHPYEVPEIVACDITAAGLYLDWLTEVLPAGPPGGLPSPESGAAA